MEQNGDGDVDDDDNECDLECDFKDDLEDDLDDDFEDDLDGDLGDDVKEQEKTDLIFFFRVTCSFTFDTNSIQMGSKGPTELGVKKQTKLLEKMF